MRVVIDRIEDGVASVELENGKMINVPAELFDSFKEGDVVQLLLDEKETQTKKKELAVDVSSLFDN